MGLGLRPRVCDGLCCFDENAFSLGFPFESRWRTWILELSFKRYSPLTDDGGGNAMMLLFLLGLHFTTQLNTFSHLCQSSQQQQRRQPMGS